MLPPNGPSPPGPGDWGLSSAVLTSWLRRQWGAAAAASAGPDVWRACCVSGFRTTGKMKQNPDVPGKSKASPEVHGVLLTLAGGAGSIRRSAGSPAASNPLSCEIVCDRPDPEAPASSSQEVPAQPPGRPLAHPKAGAARSPFSAGSVPDRSWQRLLLVGP